MAFLAEERLEQGLAQRHLLVAYGADDTIAGLASLALSPERDIAYCDHLLRSRHTPPGCSELLIREIFSFLEQHPDKLGYFTMGLSPLDRSSHFDSPNPLWLKSLLRLGVRSTRAAYHFEGLARFREKLRPDQYICQYYLFDTSPARALYDLVNAFVDESPLRFSREWLRRIAQRTWPAWTIASA